MEAEKGILFYSLVPSPAFLTEIRENTVCYCCRTVQFKSTSLGQSFIIISLCIRPVSMPWPLPSRNSCSCSIQAQPYPGSKPILTSGGFLLKHFNKYPRPPEKGRYRSRQQDAKVQKTEPLPSHLSVQPHSSELPLLLPPTNTYLPRSMAFLISSEFNLRATTHQLCKLW